MLDGYRAERIAGFLSKYVQPGGRALDCGCGGMTVAHQVEQISGGKVIGIDVINVNQNGMPMCLGEGAHLPFVDNSFDVVYTAFVLHHTVNARAVIQECLRVTRQRVIILEDVYRSRLELLLLKVLDWVGNRSISADMPFPFTFKQENVWQKMFRELGVRSIDPVPIRPMPWRPSRHRMFVLEKAHDEYSPSFLPPTQAAARTSHSGSSWVAGAARGVGARRNAPDTSS